MIDNSTSKQHPNLIHPDPSDREITVAKALRRRPRTGHTRQWLHRLALGSAIVIALTHTSCTLPAVNLATDEPIKVDINMRLDVYQHGEPGTAPTAAAQTEVNPDSPVPQASRENRQADIQVFKNSRLVGEGRDGLLVVLEEPPGDYGSYLRRTVQLENDARMADMNAIAEKEQRALPEIRKEQASLWYNRSFTGEWVEIQQPGGAYKWIQKEG